MTAAAPTKRGVLALSGGVGGAKLVEGLAQVLEPDAHLAVCNTGDDFEHLGLHIAPDLDSVLYALAGLNDQERGWGRAEESWHCMEELRRLGAESWFQLGDRDLALHLERTRRLRAGATLSEATRDLAQALGVKARLAPMSDQPVRTVVATDQGNLAFQHYFVRERCEPQVRGFTFEGASDASPSPPFLAALDDPRLDAIVLCPSNPWVSIDPILALPGVANALREQPCPIVAVSPIVGGKALKGPAAKMMRELGLDVSALEVARHYAKRGLIDAFVLDATDSKLEADTAALGLLVRVADTVMHDARDRARLATEVVDFCASLRPTGAS